MIDAERDVKAKSLDRRKLREAGISTRHLKVLLDTSPLIETTSLRTAREFRTAPSLWCLTLSGSHGVGKTFAAEWLVVQAIRAGEIALDGIRRVVTPFDIQDACFDPTKRQKLQATRFLAIDDLGCEREGVRTSNFSWCLEEVIDFRWRHEKTTIITTNLAGRDLLRRYGHRIVDRLRDSARCVVLSGANLRGQCEAPYRSPAKGSGGPLGALPTHRNRERLVAKRGDKGPVIPASG